MSQDPQRWISYKALTELAGTDASERDQDGLFPEHAFEGLRQLGVVGKPPLQSVEVGCLLRVLAAIGRGNLSVGRIYEGHVNALLLIRWFGNAIAANALCNKRNGRRSFRRVEYRSTR